ncbi:hypothetical protein TorRG33x02_002410 [Trema orientale]|uniref:Uncharacterized protein n=1 Tax=Trema orientale TaxID=63057 RepID=A0A2P5G1P2_TREOI|nr:hypothetical protein TorRG33x02_002410 [Trema orientale]
MDRVSHVACVRYYSIGFGVEGIPCRDFSVDPFESLGDSVRLFLGHRLGPVSICGGPCLKMKF